MIYSYSVFQCTAKKRMLISEFSPFSPIHISGYNGRICIKCVQAIYYETTCWLSLATNVAWTKTSMLVPKKKKASWKNFAHSKKKVCYRILILICS